MLINFKFKNFRNYYKEQNFSFTAKSYNDYLDNIFDIDTSVSKYGNNI